MATHTPSDPAGTLKAAADNSGSFKVVEKEDLSQEYTKWPVCAIDPTEDEDESESITTNGEVYEEEVDYIVHVMSLRDGDTPRSDNDSLVDDFLDQLFADTRGTDEEGDYEKVRRTRVVGEIGTDEAYISSLVIRVSRQSTYR